MKILRLSTFLDFGGVETRLANISYVKDSNEWVFACMGREGKAAEVIRNNGKRVINLNVKPSIYSFFTLFKIYRLLKMERPDVVHTSGAEANFHGILAAKLAGVPRIIGEEIGTPHHSKKAQFIFSKIYSFANYVIGNSQSVLDAVHVLDRVPKKKLIKVDNPIIFKDLSDLKKSELANFSFKMLMISRLEPVKNIRGVINAVYELIRNGEKVHLTIAGDGILEYDLKLQVRNLKLEDDISFVGFITNPYPYLVNTDLYILNSFSEGFSNSLIESMYSRCPSLSTTVGAATEIIIDNENGFLIPPNDEINLYNKIKNIISIPKEKREVIGLNGYKTVMQNFSLEKHLSKLMHLYNSI